MVRPAADLTQVEHHLISFTLAPSVHLHGYVMSADRGDMLDVANRMLHEAKKLGCSGPLLGLVLGTRLAADSVATVRKILCERHSDAERLLRESADFYFAIWNTCDGDPADAKLMALH